MSVPKFYELHRPILKSLEDGAVHSNKDVAASVIALCGLQDDDLAKLLPSGRQTVFLNRLGWARTYLKKAGLIIGVSRSLLKISEEGLLVLQNGPSVIHADYLTRYDSFREFVNTKKKEATENDERFSGEEETPDDVFEESFTKINRKLAEDLITEVMKLDPVAFEKMVLDLLSKMGYGTFENAAQLTSKTRDEGIDGIIMQDKLGFDLIYIQVKRWNEDHPVGRPEIQAFYGAIAGKSNKGLYVTTSYFTNAAIDYANRQHIILMDRDKLAKYMIEYNFGVTVKRVFEIKKVDYDLFADYQGEE